MFKTKFKKGIFAITVLLVIYTIGMVLYLKHATDKVPVAPMDTSLVQNPCMDAGSEILGIKQHLDQDCMRSYQNDSPRPYTSWKEEEAIRRANQYK